MSVFWDTDGPSAPLAYFFSSSLRFFAGFCRICRLRDSWSPSYPWISACNSLILLLADVEKKNPRVGVGQ